MLVLPGGVLVLVPGLLWWATRHTALQAGPWPPSPGRWVAALALAAVGAPLAGGATHRFFRHGAGTAAPWDPPRRLVVAGPYRHVRNPMLCGVFLLLGAEALLLGSWAVGAWWLAFVLGNAVYFPLIEEPGLRRRFGAAYEEYCRHVRRWVPRLRPWTPPPETERGPAPRRRPSS